MKGVTMPPLTGFAAVGLGVFATEAEAFSAIRDAERLNETPPVEEAVAPEEEATP
jgi:hypothetical protein